LADWSDDGPEQPLSGGNVNAAVVRIGQTVRRVPGPYSANVHALLHHLEAVGFDASPRFLGIDAQRREVLSFIPGQAGQPDDMFSTTMAMIRASQLLRRYHDATTGFSMDPQGWARSDPDPARREVICHNDAAPYNMIFEAGLPIALIDFDLAGPGPRLRDLAYLAIWCVPLLFGPDAAGDAGRADLAAGCPRLRLIAASYGTDDLPGLLAEAEAMLVHMGDQNAMLHMLGPTVAARLIAGGHLAHWQTQLYAFRQELAQLRRVSGLGIHPAP
jgi:Phosphotransferase enzyme family